MSRKVSVVLLIGVVLWIWAIADLQAQTSGRLSLTLLDPEGEPVVGAVVRVSRPDSPRSAKERTTDKKGRVLISFADATASYRLQIEAEGFHPVDMMLDPEPGVVQRREMQLEPVRDVAAGPEAVSEGALSEAGEALAAGVEALRAGDLDTAEVEILRALEVDSELAPAHSALAGLYLQRGRYKEAIAAAQRLRELQPENPRGFRALYEAHKALGHTQEATAALAQLSQLGEGGDTAAILYNEGVESMKAGDAGAAKKRFQEAVAVDPEFVQAHIGLAICHLRAGSSGEAAAAAEMALALEPGNIHALGISVDAYRALGDKDKEEAALAALRAADPRTAARQMYDTGVQFYDAGDTRSAMSLFQRALEFDPEHAAAHYKLGLCYINTGETDKAKEHLQRFLELAPEHPEAAGAQQMLQYLG